MEPAAESRLSKTTLRQFSTTLLKCPLLKATNDTAKHKLANVVNKTFMVSTFTKSSVNHTKTGLNPNIKLAETANNKPLCLSATLTHP
jgi:hypothetical protein